MWCEHHPALFMHIVLRPKPMAGKRGGPNPIVVYTHVAPPRVVTAVRRKGASLRTRHSLCDGERGERVTPPRTFGTIGVERSRPPPRSPPSTRSFTSY